MQTASPPPACTQSWVARLGFVAFVLVALALLEPEGARAPLPVAPAAERLELVVRVFERGPAGEVGAPLSDVVVELHELDEEHYRDALRAEPKATGVFRLARERRAAWLVVRKPGYARAAVPIPADDDRREVTVLLARGRALTIDVRAVDEAGELVPLERATVLVGDTTTLPLARATDATGRAAFGDLPEGPLFVQVFARGYEPFSATTEADLLVRLRPVMGLVVRVERGGQPAPGATVHVSGLTLWPERVLATDALGRVEVTGLGAGNYSLYAEQDTFVSEGLVGVELEGTRGTREVVLELRPGEFLDVRVVSDLEEPVPLAEVTWSADGLGQFARRGETSTAGLLRLGPVAHVTGLLQVTAPGFVERVVPVDESSITVVLDRAGTIVGRVVDERGFPVVGAEIEVVGTDLHGMPVFVRHEAELVREAHFEWALASERRLIPAGELGVLLGPVPPIPLGRSVGGSVSGPVFTSGEGGRFRVPNVPPGAIVVLARHADFIDGKSPVVRLAPGGEAETEVVLRAGESLRGRVLDHRGFPVPGARVELTGRGYERSVHVESDGTFVVNAAPPEVTLRVTHVDRPLRVLYEERSSKRKPNEEIVLELPEPREASLLEIVDAEGEPIGLAEVRIVSKDPRVPLEETRFSSDLGEVEFPDTRGLEVRALVRAPGFVDDARALVLRAEQTVRLVAAVTAVGRITAVRGRWPAADAEVVVTSGGTKRRVHTNEAGEYRLTGLAPGPATLAASHPEHGRAETSVTIAPGVNGREAELPDLDLVPSIEVSGRVVDARGFPVVAARVSDAPLSVYLPRTLAESTSGAAVTDESGRFSFRASRGEKLELFAVQPAVAFGSVSLPTGDRDRIEDVEIRLEALDVAPVDELGTALFGLELAAGRLRIAAVHPDPRRPADDLARGDVLLAIDDETPRDLEDARILLSGPPGTTIQLDVERRGTRRRVTLTREAFLR